MRSAAATFAAGLALLGVPEPALAHPLAPSLLELRERGDGIVDVRWKQPLIQPAGARLRPELPARCTPRGAPRLERLAASAVARWSEDCGGEGLVGGALRVHGLDESGTDALVRVELADGRSVRAVLAGSRDALVVPARQARVQVARQYAGLGFAHILSGPDHLLFVLGLLLLVAGVRPLVATISAFTLGHSVTLSLAVLGFVRFPTGPIELAIAASILALAVELRAGEGSRSGASRRPWLLAGSFGLLHGLGFAGALSQAGLPAGEVPLALLAFNAGIELGQLLFVAAVLLAGAVLRARVAAVPGWLARVPATAIGALAACWCFERAAGLL